MVDRYVVQISKDGRFYHVLDRKRVVYVKTCSARTDAEACASRMNAKARA